jgi:hypothetical protein
MLFNLEAMRQLMHAGRLGDKTGRRVFEDPAK